MKFINVILVCDDSVQECHLLFDIGRAEQKFVELCEQHFPTWNLLDADAKLKYLEDGYFTGHDGSDGYNTVFLAWPTVQEECVLSH